MLPCYQFSCIVILLLFFSYHKLYSHMLFELVLFTPAWGVGGLPPSFRLCMGVRWWVARLGGAHWQGGGG